MLNYGQNGFVIKCYADAGQGFLIYTLGVSGFSLALAVGRVRWYESLVVAKDFWMHNKYTRLCTNPPAKLGSGSIRFFC